MSENNIHGTFVSEKISKIRWRPDLFGASTSFLTGSWDNDQNTIKLWNLATNIEEYNDVYPEELKSFMSDGDITELKFLSQDFFIASTSSGSVLLLQIIDQSNGTYEIKLKMPWYNVHKFDSGEISSCTGLSTYDEDIVSVGEDGRLNLFTAKRESLIRTINNADSCSFQCVTFLKYNEVLTGNGRGQMKIWDLRNNSDLPSSSFMLNGEQIPATCLTFHPNQRHMVLAGDEEGSITIWDLRQNTFPVNLVSAHTEAVTEIQFHPSYPDHLFSCANNGDIWHWNTLSQSKHPKLNMTIETESYNPWFSSESIKNKLEVISLMPKLHKPINSLDLDRNRVLCGCDNEAVYFINNINVM